MIILYFFFVYFVALWFVFSPKEKRTILFYSWEINHVHLIIRAFLETLIFKDISVVKSKTPNNKQN